MANGRFSSEIPAFTPDVPVFTAPCAALAGRVLTNTGTAFMTAIPSLNRMSAGVAVGRGIPIDALISLIASVRVPSPNGSIISVVELLTYS